MIRLLSQRLSVAFFICVTTSSVIARPPALAADFHVSAAGSDSNDCTSSGVPCRTLARTCSVIPLGVHTLHIASGAYDNDSCNLIYYRVVTVITDGLDASGKCADRSAVSVRAAAGVIFYVQDSAILGLNCLTMGTSAGGSGVIGVQTRQFAIADFVNVDFATIGIAVSATEMSKANCGGTVGIIGDIGHFPAADGGSTIIATCPFAFVNSPAVQSIFSLGKESRVEAWGATFSGTAKVAHKYIIDRGTLYLPVANDPVSVPGSATIVQNGGVVF
jgi:hypothetical protein